MAPRGATTSSELTALAYDSRLGPYRLLHLLGEGGMGSVYAAIDERSGRRVAVKILLNASSRAVMQFKSEFRALAGLHHPNLIALHELALVDGEWLLAMELVDGVDFLSYADTEQKLRLSLLQLADGLEVLHRAGQVHRDIKPSNVTVTPGGRVVLLDFGLATAVTRPKTEPGGYVMGTIDYVAPERLVVRGKLSHATDWYSVGVMLYVALTGRAPFSGSHYDIVRGKLRADPVPPIAIRPDAPADLSALCMSLLHRDPARRAGRHEIIATLRGIPAAGEQVSANTNTPLVGRHRHLHTLERCAAAVDAGRPTLALLSGESGIGKSALMASFLARVAARDDALVLHGRCYAREAVPYKGLDMIADQLSTTARRLPAVLGRLARQRLVVVAIDDVQWIDSAGAELLRLLAGPAMPPLLVLLAYRSDAGTVSAPLHSILDDVHAADGAREVHELVLEPLSAADVNAVARTIAPDARVDADRIAASSGGNPFFVHELARFARTNRATTALPTVAEVLAARIAALPDTARAVLEVIAVAGHPLPIPVALDAAGAFEPSVLSVLRAEHLVRYVDAGGHDVVECYHDRIRELVAAAVSASVKSVYHARLAAASAELR